MDNRDQPAQNLPEELAKLLRVHDATTAQFRAELLQRSAGEVLFDDYLLTQMRKGKPFAVALRKANAKYPAEALNARGPDLADAEAHYRFLLDMEKVDGWRRELEKNQRKIEETDEKIAELLRNFNPE